MRTLTLAVGIVSFGTIAALPFRRAATSHHPATATLNASGLGENPSLVTGPLEGQMESDSFGGVVPWPDRRGIDASIAWQPRPMILDSSPVSFEMPTMPDTFPDEALEVPMPAPLRDRYEATLEVRRDFSPPQAPLGVATTAPASTPPMTAAGPSAESLIRDRFVFTPPPSLPDPPRPSTFQPASLGLGESPELPSTQDSSENRQRLYIREP